MYYKSITIEKESERLPQIFCSGSTTEELARYRIDIGGASGTLYVYEKENRDLDYRWRLIYATSGYEVRFESKFK